MSLVNPRQAESAPQRTVTMPEGDYFVAEINPNSWAVRPPGAGNWHNGYKSLPEVNRAIACGEVPESPIPGLQAQSHIDTYFERMQPTLDLALRTAGFGPTT